MAQVHVQWCEDHRSSYLGDCPFCLAGLEPTRFLEARRDFQGLPLPNTLDILPHYPVVALEDVLRVLGQQLAELEKQEAEAIRPYAEAKSVIYRQMRKAHIDPRTMQRAVRVLLGMPNTSALEKDPAVSIVLRILRGGKL
jgi:hypothetical protein